MRETILRLFIHILGTTRYPYDFAPPPLLLPILLPLSLTQPLKYFMPSVSLTFPLITTVPMRTINDTIC